jgi:hypothetical protein
LLPQQYDGIIMAEKGISVSNVVNGTTRLQPVVMLTGQAAGMLAAISVQRKKQPRQISIRQLQSKLIDARAYIMPYYDVKPSHHFFAAIQRIGATGILKGTGEPYKWANRTWFYPDSVVNTKELIKDIEPFVKVTATSLSDPLDIDGAISLITTKEVDVKKIEAAWTKWGLTKYDSKRIITRAEMAVLLDNTINPFAREVDHNGIFK